MGLACPVCEVPHPDAEHLADHVAITATTRAGDHRAWLDERAPDWAEMTRTDLGELIAEHAEEVDSIDLHEEVANHESGTRGRGSSFSDRTAADAPDELDDEARAVLADARELTERMRDEGDDDAEGDGSDGGDDDNGE